MSERSRSALAAAVAAVDELADDAVAGLRAAVRVPSISPVLDPDSPGEAACNEVLADVARRLGLEVDLWAVAPGRANLAAWAASGGRDDESRRLLLGGHVDVVPAGDPAAWTRGDPFGGDLDGGRVWGRGACDMKAGVVAALVAVAALDRAGVRTGGRAIAHSIVGEESNEHELGVDALLARGHGAAGAVIGEPTSGRGLLVPAIATVGWLFCDLELTGRSTHVALRGTIRRQPPDADPLGVNAVEKAMELLAHLGRLEDEWRTTKSHPLWEAGDFCIHPGSLRAGPSGTDNPAIYGDVARLRCSVLYPPGERSADVRAEVEAHVARLGDHDPWFRRHPVRISWSLDWPPAEQAPDSPLVRACVDAAGDLGAVTGTAVTERPAAMLGVCDASWFAQSGVAAIACGPGDIGDAHAADESVAVAELLQAAKLYAAQAIRFCGVR